MYTIFTITQYHPLEPRVGLEEEQVHVFVLGEMVSHLGRHAYSRVNCVPNTFQPSRDPSTGCRCMAREYVIVKMLVKVGVQPQAGTSPNEEQNAKRPSTQEMGERTCGYPREC